MDVDQLAAHVIERAANRPRFMTAITGPPGAGKSTLAGKLVEKLNSLGHRSRTIPMDGFHLDNSILQRRNLLARKGSPETFDAIGFGHLIKRLSAVDGDVYFPVFDREKDIAIAGADCAIIDDRFLVVEGNYLLLDTPPWNALQQYWDETIFIDPGMKTLETRLIQRWLDNGLSEKTAVERAEGNDLPNARLVLKTSTQANIIVDE